MTDVLSISVVSIKVAPGCEMVRWLLERAWHPFVEQFPAPLLHAIATRAAGGGNEAPVLVVETHEAKSAYDTSATIIEAIDRLCPAGPKVYRQTEAERGAGKAFIARVVPLFGPWMRRYRYASILNDPALLKPLATAGLPARPRSSSSSRPSRPVSPRTASVPDLHQPRRAPRGRLQQCRNRLPRRRGGALVRRGASGRLPTIARARSAPRCSKSRSRS